MVTAPIGGYTAGESYILNVGSKAHSSKGKALKNEYNVNFNIESNTNSDNVITFKDKNLEKAVRDEIKKPTGDIYKSDVEKITEFTAKRMEIQDISGIENLTNLQSLNLENNDITDISPLKELTNLSTLVLYGAKLNDISALKGLTNLQKLNLSYTQISDISVLKGLTNLKTLYVGDNQISDVDNQSLESALPNCIIKYIRDYK